MGGEAAWTRRTVVGAGLAALGVGSGLTGSAAAQAASDAQAAAMQLTDIGNLLVRARVGGQPSLVMLDPTLPWSLLDLGFARQRGWDSPRDRTPAGVPTRTQSSLEFQLASVRQMVRPRLIDLSLFGLVDGEPLVAIMGPEMFGERRLVFDFDAMRFALAGASRAMETPAGAASFAVERGAASLSGLPLDVEGAASIRASIDLAQACALTISAGEAADAWLADGREWSTSFAIQQGMGSSAEAKNIMTSLKSVRIGAFELRDVPVEITAAEGGAPAGPSRLVIGPDLLSRFFAVLDPAQGQVTLAPRAAHGRTFRRNLIGLGLRADGDALRVMHVGANSPGADAGFKVDDRVVSIDGAPPKRETLRAAAEGQAFRIALASGVTHEVTARRHY